MTAPRGRRQPPGQKPRAVATEDTIVEAIEVVDRAAPVFVDPLQTWLNSHPGRAAQVPLRTLFIGMLINAPLDNDAFITNTTRVLRGLPPGWRRRLRIEVDGHVATYRQVWTVWHRSRQGIGVLNTYISDPTLRSEDAANWLLNRVLDATRPNDIRLGRARAMDSTDIETWARTRTDANGRRWTKDPDVLEGHSPAKNGEPGRVRFLSELHLSVPVREEDGHPVPGLITGAFLGQANFDRARAIEFLVDDERAHGDDINEAVFDRGYSGLLEDNVAVPLDERGVDKTIDLMPSQRGPQPPFRGAVSRDGSLFCPATPAGLLDKLDPHCPNMKADATQRLAAQYDERERYGFRVRQAAKVSNRAVRMECPARAGHVRCPLVPSSLRLPYTKPSVVPPEDPPPCCTQATITVPNEVNIRTRQKHGYGTTKWRTAYNRRPQVETANSLIKTHFAAVRRGYMRTFGLEAQALLMAFTLAATNIRLLETYRHRTAA